MDAIKLFIHQLRNHKGGATHVIFLTEKNIQQRYHVVAYVCDGCDSILRIEAVPNTRTDDQATAQDAPKGEDVDGSVFSHVNSKGVRYYLNKKAVSLRGGKLVDIFYFTKDRRPEAITALPEGRTVRENPRNGFLTVQRTEEEHSCGDEE